MSQDHSTDLHAGVLGAAAYRKRILVVDVAFPETAGVVPTLEGEVGHAAGDAIVTGVSGEHWPIARETFFRKYDAVPPTRAGDPGQYRSRPSAVLARQMTSSFEIVLPDGKGVLRGDAGAWLVQYGPGDQAVVARDIFSKTYEPAEHRSKDA